MIFKNKKGLDYIDWTLSMGMFLIIVIALFVFLRPGAQPAFEGKNLINIVEENLLIETDGAVKETPLFIKKLNQPSTGNPASVELTLSGNWRFSKISPASSPLFTPITVNPKKIKIECSSGSCSQVFNVIWTPTKASPSDPLLDITCTPSADTSVCDAVLGSTETFEGVHQSFLTSLQTAGYATVKANWNFPDQKEFAIYLDGSPTPLIGGPDPGQQANVFVKELKYWLISGTTRQPTTISLRVW